MAGAPTQKTGADRVFFGDLHLAPGTQSAGLATATHTSQFDDSL